MITVNGKELALDFEFSGGERQVRLGDLGMDRGWSSISIRASIKSSNDMMTLLLISNAVEEQYHGEYPVFVYLWYLPYARQDRACYPGEANGSKVMRGLLDLIVADTIYVADVHSPQEFKSNVTEVSSWQILRDNPDVFNGITALVSPDQGSEGKVSRISDRLGLPMIYCRKSRSPETGQINGIDIVHGEDAIEGGNLLVIDDICDGGATFIYLAEALKKRGSYKGINLYVTHGIFSKGEGILLAEYDTITTTDSFYVENALKSIKTKVINL